MSSARYSLLGLARPRAPWFTELGRWATAGTVPVDFVRCISAEEVRARLASDRPFSALLVDANVSGLDRDLVDVARSRGCITLVMAEGGSDRDWTAIGAAAALPTSMERETLLDALETHATSVAEVLPHAGSSGRRSADGWRGRLVAVTGPGGTGASVLAMALCQALGDDARNAGHVLLADFALHADQGMLHGSPDVVPGVSELVEAHRTGNPDGAAVRSNTFDVAGRGYQLLLGLRRRRHWAALRPRAVEAALASVLQTYRHVVADVDADLDGDRECGSIEVEERNALARTTIARADAVIVVGLPTLKGMHALLRCLADVVDFGVAPARLVPVLNQAPRSPRARAELAKAFASLTGGFVDPAALSSPVPVPTQRRWEEALRDGVRLPDGPGRILLGAVDAVVGRTPGRPRADEPVAIQPGTLGAYWDERAVS